MLVGKSTSGGIKRCHVIEENRTPGRWLHATPSGTLSLGREKSVFSSERGRQDLEAIFLLLALRRGFAPLLLA